MSTGQKRKRELKFLNDFNSLFFNLLHCTPAGVRTLDTLIKSQVLYQLSYGCNIYFCLHFWIACAKVLLLFDTAKLFLHFFCCSCIFRHFLPFCTVFRCSFQKEGAYKIKMCLPRQSLRTTPHKEGKKGSSLWEHSIPLEENCEWIEEKEQNYIRDLQQKWTIFSKW